MESPSPIPRIELLKMRSVYSRPGNVVVVTMFCLILVMFFAALVLDVGLIEVTDKQTADVSAFDAESAPPTQKSTPAPIQPVVRSDQPLDNNSIRVVLESLDRSKRQAGTFAIAEQRAFVSLPPRDIVFVVDLSGSMNDDTENVWATKSIETLFEDTEYAGIGENLVQQFYTDMNFGTYPGKLEYIGKPLGGIPSRSDAYHQMTRNDGKLSKSNIASQYRIDNSDTEKTRKKKAYKWMIDHQIAKLMPNAKPTPDSEANYEFWEKYLDYVMVVKYIGVQKNRKKKKRSTNGGESGSTQPNPSIGRNLSELPRYTSWLARYQPLAMLHYRSLDRGWIPPDVDTDRIYKFNNPNTSAYPDGDTNTRWQLRNKLGYRTYAQFLMDWGRDGKPEGNTFVQSSVKSAFCPFHDEHINGETFLFPPRTQPMNSVRRSLISALQTIRDRNHEFGMTSNRDLVAIMTFDRVENGISIRQTLTDDYESAMDKCCKLQATQDSGSSTATELGLKHAYEYLRPVAKGGVGRVGANKVVVLLTDGLPNAYVSSKEAIDQFIDDHPEEEDFYESGYYWFNAALMQGKMMQNKAENWYIYPVGIGFGTDYDFMDRVARIGATAIDGQAMRGTRNPARYEESLKSLLDAILSSSSVSLDK